MADRPVTALREPFSWGRTLSRVRLPVMLGDPSESSMPRDYTTICFVIMPFGIKPVGDQKVDFDKIYDGIFEPAIQTVPLPEGGVLEPRRTDKDFFTGDIGQEMFEYLNHSRFALADITGLNANVMYEIGVRHAVRESGTAIFRQGGVTIPFDINRIKAFPYNYQPEDDAAASRALIARVLRESLGQNALDSPVQIALKAQREEPNREVVQALLLEAENAVRNFDRPAAISKLREALAAGQGNALVHVRLGILLRDQGDLPGAVAGVHCGDRNFSRSIRMHGVRRAFRKRASRRMPTVRTRCAKPLH